jgi:hypothetical protein
MTATAATPMAHGTVEASVYNSRLAAVGPRPLLHPGKFGSTQCTKFFDLEAPLQERSTTRLETIREEAEEDLEGVPLRDEGLEAVHQGDQSLGGGDVRLSHTNRPPVGDIGPTG